MRFRAADLRQHGWTPPQTLQIPDWCGCSAEYLPVPAGDGWWAPVPIWEPAQTVNPLRRYGRPSRTDFVAIQRLRRPPQPVTFTEGALTLYEVELNAAPSRAWRAAFLHPPAALTAKDTPELGRFEIHGPRITFRTIPARLHAWLRRIDRWIAYANSTVEE